MKTPLIRRICILAAIGLLSTAQLAGQTPQTSLPAAASAVASGPSAASPTAASATPEAPAALQKHAAPLTLTAASLPPGAGGRQQSLAPDSQTLHLIVGRSLFMDLPEKLRRVYVSNPQVLDALAASPLEVVITAKAAGTSSLVLWSNGGAPNIYTVLADVDVAGLRDSLAQALPGDHVEVEAQQGRVHLSGVVDSDGAADEAGRLAGVYSKDVINALVVDPRHLPQVQLAVRIVEIDRSKLTAFGINLFSLGKNSGSSSTEQFSPPSFQTQNGTNTAVISDFLNLFYFNLPHGLGTTIKDLQTKGILEILAEPTLITLQARRPASWRAESFLIPSCSPGEWAACPPSPSSSVLTASSWSSPPG
jgi:pilus assembly protein CpaC